MSNNYFTGNEDIQFHFNQRINFEEIFSYLTAEQKEALSCQSPEELKSSVGDILSAFGEVCAKEIAPHAEEVEKQGVRLGEDGDVIYPERLKANIELFREMGLGGLTVSAEYGGIDAPFFSEAICIELMQRACPSTAVNLNWYGPIAHVIQMFGNQEQKEQIIPKAATGEWSGCMALTEADAGSDLSNMSSYCEKNEDGTYRVFGSKRFITNGCGEYALMLAMSEKGAKGLNKINLMLVPRKIDGKHNYTISKLEEKLGLHGSPTCELQFDGSKATILGKENEGFRYMLKLMNDARIGVGMQGLGIMESSLNLAKEYCQQRFSWGKPIAQHEMVAEKLHDMDVMLKATRSLTYQAAISRGKMFQIEKYIAENKENLSEDEIAKLKKKASTYSRRVRKWTPLVKWWVGEKTPNLARQCLELHGGYGFSTEYRAEAWLRESIVLSLYEGTSHIQALMCLKDTLKDTMRNKVRFIEKFTGYRVSILSERDSLRKKLYKAKFSAMKGTVSILFLMFGKSVKSQFSDMKPQEVLTLIKNIGPNLMKLENLSPALLNAERLCELHTIAAMAHALVLDAEVDPSRRPIAERFLDVYLPRMDYIRSLMNVDDEFMGDFSSASESPAMVGN